MRGLGPIENAKGMTYVQIAHDFVPETARERKLKELCKLTCDGGSEKGRCDCYSPLECQLVTISKNRANSD